MRVAVTGGSGFLGRAVVRELVGRGHDVFYPSHSAADLTTDYGRRKLFSAHCHDAIVHVAAAVGGVGANVAEPGRFSYENLVMGAELLESARKNGTQKFVTIGTSCEYPENAPLPLREESLWDGRPAGDTAAYGLAKRALLEMGLAYRRQYGMNVIHLLPTNLYGPGDHFNAQTGHVIPSLIQKIVRAEAQGRRSLDFWGSGSQTRDFLYVDDAARGIRMALEGYDDPEPLNLGSGEEHSIATVADIIREIIGFDGGYFWDGTRPSGVKRRVMDVSRARDLLGFEAATKLPNGLRNTIFSFLDSLVS